MFGFLINRAFPAAMKQLNGNFCPMFMSGIRQFFQIRNGVIRINDILKCGNTTRWMNAGNPGDNQAHAALCECFIKSDLVFRHSAGFSAMPS